ncbi:MULTISPECIES: monovalent cation:proton antiporter-2 (CPA2) family protein [Thermodesulfovibrio]|jgi:CPA2 family monovalent cation:H+ antiporter-2|uniref:monovalent cation:proton antiporter-2 (CPA2) family protein n=1 Tax=Thermodesulfovibrio TaxID=28261 RepID=UPI002621B51E|nr:monovalent cation:proton antiporter-2 (CPA2) family protein [Thermodesulfovibrio sp.]
MIYEFLQAILIIFGISGLIIYFLGKLHIPPIVGFLLAGTIIGPYGLGLIKDPHEVEVIAEIGVILLMFTIGIEFSIPRLLSLKKEVFLLGMLQVAVTILTITLISQFTLNADLNNAIFYGFIVALSSTAIVMKLLADRGELNTPHGKICLGILLFQDLCVVPLMLFTQMLSGKGGSYYNFFTVILKASVILSIVFLFSRIAVPYILHEVVKTKSRELFIIVTISICLGTAFFTSKLGLSLALGAFLAGVVISESEYSAQVVSDILPFKETFSGIFFISVGMLLNLEFISKNLIEEIILVGNIFIIKATIIILISYVFIHSLKVSLKSAFSLSQIGEFSFILAFTGKASGLLDETTYQSFISASVITMLVTPLIIKYSPNFIDYIIQKEPFKYFEKSDKIKDTDVIVKKSNHVIIIGFGLNGRNLARVLKETKIPYTILELNPDTVRKMKKKGEPIYYGDGTSQEILHKLGLKRAKALVVAISDPTATRRIVQIAKTENPKIHIIVRTRFITEMEELRKLGADEVIPEEFETSLEIFARVLHLFGVPRNKILQMIETIRQEGYEILRLPEQPRTRAGVECVLFEGLEMDSFQIDKDSWLKGHSLRSLDLRHKAKVTVIAIQRGQETFLNPPADFTLKEGDIIIYVGNKRQLIEALSFFQKGSD